MERGFLTFGFCLLKDFWKDMGEMGLLGITAPGIIAPLQKLPNNTSVKGIVQHLGKLAHDT